MATETGDQVRRLLREVASKVYQNIGREAHLDFSFWKERWESGRIGFHQAEVNRHLAKYIGLLADPHASGVLLPLCGKTHDLTWLTDHFDRVVGVEFVEAAVRDYYDERGVPYEQSSLGSVRRFVGGGVTMLAADFHEVTLTHTGPVSRVFDRASMIALPRATRPRYAAHLVSLMPPGGKILLVTMSYDQHLAAGPPFSVGADEVQALYQSTCTIERLETLASRALPERLAALDVSSTVWLLTKK